MFIQNLRRRWQIKTGRVDTPFDGEIPFWVASFCFHLILLLLLARLIIPNPKAKEVELVLDTTQAVEITELPTEFEFDEEFHAEIGADSQNGLEVAANEAPEVDIINEDAVEIDLATDDVGEFLTDDDFIEASSENMSTLSVKGSVGHSVTGAAGAVDRISKEIVLSLDERKTLVVWMFDESASLIKQRDQIAARFDKVYEELGILQTAGNKAFAKHLDKPLLTQIVGFGQFLHPMLEEPTDDLEKIKKAVANVQLDRSGEENVFSSVTQVAEKYKHFHRRDPKTGDRRRNVMIIIVSDEAGDDAAQVDECVAICNKYETPVFVIGVPAPFGRKETMVKWVDPDPNYDQSPQMASVSQGPETLAPERIRLDFSGTFNDLDMIDSGFGPFNLTRLCYETGGIYFAVHPNRRTNKAVSMWETSNYSAYLRYFFDPKVMRAYKPDYVSQATYLQRLEKNKARAALVKAAMYTNTGVLQPPNLVFPKLNEAQFVRAVTVAQQAAARVEPELDRLHAILKEGEKDRELEDSLRWQAGYDLALGRTLAAKVRASSYNQMLAMAKTKLKFSPPPDKDTPQNNTWRLRPADNIETGSQQAKMAEKAKFLLNRVVTSHPDTPWAMLATRELATPIGWKWKETYTAPPRQVARSNNNNSNNARPRRVPQPRQNAIPKPRRAPPKL